METHNPINVRALKELKQARPYLTPQQYRTIKGQILAGQHLSAVKGLNKLLQKRGSTVS